MSNRMPIIVSHFTKGTGYEREVQNLVESLEKLKLNYSIEGIESLGNWRQNSNYCSKNVAKALAAHPDRDILRVDADAVFHRCPDLFLQDDFRADIAAHVANFPWHPRELLGGTLFFRNNATVRWLVDFWVWKCTIDKPTMRNGDLLQEILDSGKFNAVFTELPPEYCKIFDIMRNVREPVIEHFQASRRLKRIVNIMGARRLA